MPRHDITALKRGISLPDLIERHGVQLNRQSATEYKALCPFHNEKSPSFSVFQKDGDWKYYCFGCGAGADHIDFIQMYDNCDTPQAIDRLAEMVGGAAANDNRPAQGQSVKPETPPDPWQHTTGPDDPPATLRIKREGNWQETPVVAAWVYRNAAGDVLGYACRVEPAPGKKDVIPVCWMANAETGEVALRQKSLAKPRSLYGAELLAASPGKQVIITEGEKAADAARRLIGGRAVVVTWPGGCKAVRHADWQQLAGRKIVFWPDCDTQTDSKTGSVRPYTAQPGMAAALTAADLLSAAGAQVRIVAIPEPGEWPDGHDLADLEDEGWSGDDVLAYAKSHLATADEIRELYAPEPESEPEPPPSDEPPPPEPDDFPGYEYDDNLPPSQPLQQSHHEPYRILGMDRGVCYYLPDGLRQVVPMTPASHSKLNLLQLAPLSYWQTHFMSEKRSGEGVDWHLAVESLIRRAQRAGVWDTDLIRGRGAWWDDGRPAVHLGSKVVLDGKAHLLRDAPTDYVYEESRPIDLSIDNPLPNAEAHKFVHICENLRWEKPISGKLLAGWVFLAPICGALEWRPHIWVTGSAGSGKSTVMNAIISRALKKSMLFVQGDTSEAGIRQSLGHDAMPVVFDEFESENKKSSERVDNVMALVTMASSESGARLYKGSANGKAESFTVRSMFAFSSISVNLAQHAARTRVSVLSLYGEPESDESLAKYQAMMERIVTTLTPEYIERLQARAIALIPVIRHNAQVFAEAAAVELGSRRSGDQMGTLIAGAYALHSTERITHEAARDWIQKQDWDEQREIQDAGRDEHQCITHIMAQHIRLETSCGIQTRALGELVQRICDDSEDERVTFREAQDHLRRVGVRVDREGDGYAVSIASSHTQMKKLLASTPWVNSYDRTLLRLPGASKHDPARYAGTTHRGVTIPTAVIF